MLAFYFIFDLLGDLGVGGGQRGIKVDGHKVILCHCFWFFFAPALMGRNARFRAWAFRGGEKSGYLDGMFFDGEGVLDSLVFVGRRRYASGNLKT